MLKTMWNWLVYSSANSRKISLTVKGALVSILPLVIMAAKLADIQLQNEDLENIIEGIVVTIEAGLGLIAAIIFLYGGVRKVWRTFTGDHLGVNNRS